MKTDFSKLPREEVETRITTMLMGEMPAEEARELMDSVSRDSELLRLHDELKATISLVEEARASAAPGKISEGKREALLQSFKVVPVELSGKVVAKSSAGSWLALAAMVAFLFSVTWLLLPSLAKSKSKSMAYRARDGGEGDRTAVSEQREGARIVDTRGGDEISDNPQIRYVDRVTPRAPREARVKELPTSKPEPAVRAQTPLKSEDEKTVGKTVAAAEAAHTLRYFSDDAAKDRADASGIAGVKIELPSLNEAAQAKNLEQEVALGKSVDQLARGERAASFGFQMGGAGEGFGGGSYGGQRYGGAIARPTDTRLNEPNAPMFSATGSRMAGGQLAHTDTEAAARRGFFDLTQTARGETSSEGRITHIPGPVTVSGIDPLTGLPSAGTTVKGPLDPVTGLPAVADKLDLFAESDVKKDGTVSGPTAVGHGLSAAASETEIMALRPRTLEDQTSVGQSAVAGEAIVAQRTEEIAESKTTGAMGGAGADAHSMQYYRSNPELMKRYFPQMYEMMQRGATQGAGLLSTAAGGIAGIPVAQPPASATSEKPQEARKSEISTKDKLAGVEKSWNEPLGREALPTPMMASPARPHQRLPELAKKTEALAEVDQPAKPEVERLQRQARELERVEIARKLKERSLGAPRELRLKLDREDSDIAARKPLAPAPIPQPEIAAAQNPFSTFSLNVSDVSFKLAAASLEKGLMPEAATVRSEEFINAFDYRDPEPKGAPVGFAWERARYPFAQDRDLLRFSVKTAASGRQEGRPLNVVLLLDNSGSMERADRVRILQECLRTLSAQLRPTDVVSVVAFARTARLWVDGLPGAQAAELPGRIGNLSPEGGTNLEEAMKVAYVTARKHFSANGINRVVLLTDGAANLGDLDPESLKRKVEAERAKGIALDCFGIGWEGLNDELLETLSRNGDGRYGFVNTPEAAASEFSGQLAGALQVAASDVKVQVEWNPKRVTAYRQIGYAKHQLTKEQFRDNTVDAAEIGAAEAGNALYVVQVNGGGEGPLGTVRVRFKIPGTNDYREQEWPLAYEGATKALENSSYPLRLAGTASAFSEWLVASPYAAEVTTDRLLAILSGVPEYFAPDPRPKKLEWMVWQAKSLAGK